jgi:RNA-directed DNA polymerase
MSQSPKEDKTKKSVRIIELSSKDALDALMSNDFYCTTELPEYFDFSGVLKYVADGIGDKSLNECINGDCLPESLHGVNLDVITNKDGRYAVRPLTLANPFLYYMLARDICSEQAWTAIKECFKLFGNEHITACAIPMVKIDDKPESFKGATSILNWWNSMEQRSIELSLKYSYMFMTDITNCFGQINPESIAWALARNNTPYQTDENASLATDIQRYLRAMQEGKNIGIPQGSALFSLIAEIILGYTDMLLAQEITKAKEEGTLPTDLEYEILRYVDDYRIFCNDRDALEKISYILQHILEQFNFRMNPSKTRTSSELITDTIKPDKAFYIFNTPIESKQTYKDEEGHERKERGYDFDGFQKHLLFIYEFSKRFPNSGQLVTQLEAFSKRVEEQLSTKTISYEEVSINLETGETIKENKTKERKGHLWENISAMVAISVEIAANNLRAANNALKIASQLLSDMCPEEQQKKKEIIGLIYKKLYRIPNSAFLQVWLQNITHTTDDWSSAEVYDMPLCKIVAKRPVTLWNNKWLIPEIASTFPQDSIVDRETLAKTGQVITFKAKRQYDEMEY